MPISQNLQNLAASSCARCTMTNWMHWSNTVNSYSVKVVIHSDVLFDVKYLYY